MKCIRFILFFIVNSGFAQSYFNLSGRVLDDSTSMPIPFANVFLANTSLGTTSKDDGTYSIEKIPEGKYVLATSILGYSSASMPIFFSNDNIHLDIKLKESTTQLQEVIVNPDLSNYKKYLSIFERNFLGLTPNSKKCVIKNTKAILFEFDKEKNNLEAFTGKPIVIDNFALGYRIYYLLDEFSVDFSKDELRFFGIARFEEFKPKNKSQAKEWKKNRDKAYYGSLRHFMQSLLAHNLKKNDFYIYKNPFSDDERLIHENSFFVKPVSNQANIKGKYKVVYEKREDFAYAHAGKFSFQKSMIDFKEDSIIIYRNGYFENYKKVNLEGYLGWRECVGNLVPLDYLPEKNQAAK